MTQTSGLSASDRLLHQRIIVLGQQVDDDIANTICAQLLLLSAEDPGRDISLYINSPAETDPTTSAPWRWVWRPAWGSSS